MPERVVRLRRTIEYLHPVVVASSSFKIKIDKSEDYSSTLGRCDVVKTVSSVVVRKGIIRRMEIAHRSNDVAATAIDSSIVGHAEAAIGH